MGFLKNGLAKHKGESASIYFMKLFILDLIH